jgi:dephospho-CoA kinase
MKIVAMVGMAGSGKSEAAKMLADNGFTRIRFGDITDEEVKKRGLSLSEANERLVREQLRKELGMAAYAILNQPRIDSARQQSHVVIDGLYSWEEYLYLKDRYADDFAVVAVSSSPKTRYARLLGRNHRGLTAAEAASRDRAEIENLNKGGPIAMADFTLINESTLSRMREEIEKVIAYLNE